ncbi:hypothetical protein NSA11_08735 [Lactobacillus taiwanensis]|uniref:hypothetical protein n=1 Tax=Lactobacillus taiwanensis TaxID=508451 RepID=UPI00214A8D93|nr:hypothetical protein [Lactobacillus taiwanensis]MCR1903999.1 hypothetical protein [Lactobacillus taiwanensis]
MKSESNNLKVTRITMMVIAILGVVLACLKYPKTNELEGVRNQITATNKEIQDTKESAKNASPLNNQSNFNLKYSEGLVQDKVNKGIKMGLGGLKNTQEYNDHKKEISALVGENIANKMYKMNGDPDLTYDLPKRKSFKFLLTKNTVVYTAFERVTNIHDAKVLAVVKYQMTDGNSDKVQSEHLCIAHLEYDLTNQKVIYSQLTPFYKSINQ